MIWSGASLVCSSCSCSFISMLLLAEHSMACKRLGLLLSYHLVCLVGGFCRVYLWSCSLAASCALLHPVGNMPCVSHKSLQNSLWLQDLRDPSFGLSSLRAW